MKVASRMRQRKRGYKRLIRSLGSGARCGAGANKVETYPTPKLPLAGIVAEIQTWRYRYTRARQSFRLYWGRMLRHDVLVHGHRGARARMPENTLPAFE